MREAEAPVDDAVVALLDEPIVLVGRPPTLQGYVRIKNRSDARVVLRGARIYSESEAFGAGAPSMVNRLPTIVLQPGQAQQFPLRVTVDTRVPAGDYAGILELHERAYPVILQVTELVRLGISPPQLVVQPVAGKAVSKRVVFSNDGNLLLTIGQIGEVAIYKEILPPRTARALLLDADAGTDLGGVIADLVRQRSLEATSSGSLRVHVVDAPRELRPGEVWATDLRIDVPGELERHSRYVGMAALHTSTLEFVVPVSGEPEREEPAAQSDAAAAIAATPQRRRPAPKPKKA